jgi:hypothetical protein
MVHVLFFPLLVRGTAVNHSMMPPLAPKAAKQPIRKGLDGKDEDDLYL